VVGLWVGSVSFNKVVNGFRVGTSEAAYGRTTTMTVSYYWPMAVLIQVPLKTPMNLVCITVVSYYACNANLAKSNPPPPPAP